jgi:fumarate reductase flavoprotein subunit
MAAPIQADEVVVVGAGIAGLVAAVRAAELGAHVTVLEAGQAERYPANSRYTGGVFHLAFRDITAPADELLDAIKQTGRGMISDDLAGVLAHEAGPCIAWLAEHGADFGRGSNAPWMSRMLVPLSLQEPGFPNHWPDKGAERLLGRLERLLVDSGGRLLRGTRARRLIGYADGVRGVQAVDPEGQPAAFPATAVILADGGFQGNPELVRRYISPDPARLCQRGAGTGLGDGLTMAAAIGARLVNMDRFYGHVQVSEAIENDGLWPYPIMDLLASSALVVDGTGRRFADEGLGGVAMANAIAKLDDPLSSFLIMTEGIWESAGRAFLLPPNPTIVERGARIYRADSLPELAAELSMPGESLLTTVEQYNCAVKGQVTSGLTPARTNAVATLAAAPMLIDQAPFLAVRLAAGITYTMGGIATDSSARVRHESGAPIPGLYAAGSTTGGFEGGPESVYLGGLAKAAIFGLKAGQCAVTDRSGSARS